MKFLKKSKVSSELSLAIFLMASFVATILVIVFYIIKQPVTDRIDKIDDAMMIFWTAIAAIGTTLAWYFQYKKNKRDNEIFELAESEATLIRFKDSVLKSIEIMPHMAFVFHYEDFINQCCGLGDCEDLRYQQHRFNDKCYNSRVDYKRLSDLKKQALFTSDSYNFNFKTRKHELNIKKLDESQSETDCGYVILPVSGGYGFSIPLVIDNLNNGYFTTDGAFMCKQEGHGQLTKYDQTDIKHLILRAVVNSGAILSQMIFFLEYIEGRIVNKDVKSEAKRHLVDSQIFIELDYLVKMIFFFEGSQVNSYLQNNQILQDYYIKYSEVIDNHSECRNAVELFGKFKKMYGSTFGLFCPITSTPSNFY